MALNLVAKLLLETKNFDNNLHKSSKEIRDLTRLGNRINSSFQNFGSTLLKFSGWAGASATAFKVVKDAINASEVSADNWQKTISGAKGAYQQFLISLNQGDFSNFFNKMNQAIEQSKELYDLFDRLGSTQVNNSAAIAILEQKMAELRLLQQAGQDVAKEIESTNQKLADLKNQEVKAGRKANFETLVTTLRRYDPTLSLFEAANVINNILIKGQKVFDDAAKEYSALQKKGSSTQRVQQFIPGSLGQYNTVEKEIFDVKNLNREEQKRYRLVKAITEAEGQMAQYIQGYAQASQKATSNLQSEYRYNRWANTGGSGGGSSISGSGSKASQMGYDDYIQHNLNLFNEGLINERVYIENMIDIERDYIKELQGVERLTNEQKEKLKSANTRLDKWINQLNLYNIDSDFQERFNRANILLEKGLIDINDYNLEYGYALNDTIEQLKKMDLTNDQVINSLQKYKEKLDQNKTLSFSKEHSLGYNDIDLHTVSGIENFINEATKALEYSSNNLASSLAFVNNSLKAKDAFNKAFGYINGVDSKNGGVYVPNLKEKQKELDSLRWNEEYLKRHPLERQLEYLYEVYESSNRDILEFMNNTNKYSSLIYTKIDEIVSNAAKKGFDLSDIDFDFALKSGDLNEIKKALNELFKRNFFKEGVLDINSFSNLTEWVIELQKAADKVVLLTGEMSDIESVIERLNKKLERFHTVSFIAENAAAAFSSMGSAMSDLSGWEGLSDKGKEDLQQFSTLMYLSAAMASMSAQLIKCTNIWEYIAAIAAGTSAVISSAVAFHNASQKFANGGIVGGSSYSGDNVLVRANSGEMILNGSQQAQLFRMLNNGSSGGSNTVEFRLRGTELIGVIDNVKKKKSKI